MSWVLLRVPASSANLGPGFDTLGIALQLYLECRFRLHDGLTIRVAGCDADSISTGIDNLIWQTAMGVAAESGRSLPAIELEISNAIPLGKGLGSSAAALTAGVVIADHLLGLKWTREQVLDRAARLEGHPDNVAACVMGSITVSANSADCMARTIRLDLPESCDIAVVVPDFTLPTHEARAVLPESYSRADVVFSVQHAALLVAALACGHLGLLGGALRDRLHQPYRAKLVPGLAEILELRGAGLLGCVLSGAGPSVLVFFETGHVEVCDRVCELFHRQGHTAAVLHTGVATNGYELLQVE